MQCSVFYSKYFIVLAFMFRFMVHLIIGFTYGVEFTVYFFPCEY